MRRLLTLAVSVLFCATQATAHASEQGFVLLLPTDLYVAGGVACIVLTLALILVIPAQKMRRLFKSTKLGFRVGPDFTTVSSLVVFALLFLVVTAGVAGSHNPTRNPLPLTIWTLFWVLLVTLQGVFGNFWRWLNPWTGPYQILLKLGLGHHLLLPNWVGHWPALISFVAFSSVLLAHPAPSDPDVLALMVASYWAIHFAGIVVFGPIWLQRAEGLTVLLINYSRVAMFGKRQQSIAFGLPGWKLSNRLAPGPSLAVFMVCTLAVGSFDGLNETFWWFGKIGINPLEFPGRSAVVAENLIGMFGAMLALLLSFSVAVWLGLKMVGQSGQFKTVFCSQAPALLPIALAYHFAHYLPGFLVEIQYVFRYLSELLTLSDFRVTTGFFNTLATVRVIWLAQAGAVVFGHVIAILLSHVLALKTFGTHRKAFTSQLPLAVFMVGYTLFGLWLLASPRGV